MASLSRSRHDPAGREVDPESVPNDTPVSAPTDLAPTEGETERNDKPVTDDTPVLDQDPVVLNNSQPTQTLAADTTPAPSTQPALFTITPSNKKYIIGGAVGGGVLVLILLSLLVFLCCRRRRAKRNLGRSGGGHPEGQGQFACCAQGTCNKHDGLPQMGQKTPLKPFVLKSASVPLAPKEPPQQHTVTLSRVESTDSQKSAWSDTSNGSSPGSDGSRRGRKSVKRPPPLKLTSLITPVINGPQDNPRMKPTRSLVASPDEVPSIVVEPPRSPTPDKMRRR